MILCENYNLDHPFHSYMHFFWEHHNHSQSQMWMNHGVSFTVAFEVISNNICLLTVSDIYQLPVHLLVAMTHYGYV